MIEKGKVGSAIGASLLAGARDSGILVAAVLPFGVAFGVLAQQHGLDRVSALAMSVLVYSGSAQFVALELWGEPLSLLALWFAAFAMNARYILYGALLRPHLQGLPVGGAYGTLFFIGDANWALAMRAGPNAVPGGHSGAYLFSTGFAMYVAWVAGTAIGVLSGRLIASPQALGLDFLLIAFFATMTVGLWRGRRDILPLAVAMASALLLDGMGEGEWSIPAGGLAGSLVAALRHDV